MPLSVVQFPKIIGKVYKPPQPALPIAKIEFPKGSLLAPTNSIILPGLPNSSISGSPQGLVDFRYEDIVNAVHRCSFTLEDVDGTLESLIIANRESIFISFGYSGFPTDFSTGLDFTIGNVDFTPRREFQIVKFQPTFTGSTVTLQMECLSKKLVPSLLEAVTNESYKGLEISTIVHALAAKNNWLGPDGLPLYIEPTKTPADKVTSPDGSNTLYFRNNGLTDIAFIKQTLLPMAYSAVAQENGYIFYLDPDYGVYFAPVGRIVNPTTHQAVISKDGTAPPVRVYTNRGPDATITSWQPDIRGAVELYNGAGQLNLVKVDPYSVLQHETISYIKQSNQGKQSSLPGGPGSKTQSDVDAKRFLHHTKSTKERIEIYGQAIWRSMHDKMWQGTLRTVLDPSIKARDTIFLIIRRPNGDIHYTSGPYWISKVTHSISSNEAYSIFDLYRPGLPSDFQGQGTENIPTG